LQVVVLGEPLKRYVDRALQLVGTADATKDPPGTVGAVELEGVQVAGNEKPGGAYGRVIEAPGIGRATMASSPT
jgi:hypothetical protein